MRLVKQTAQRWQYLLNQHEANVLRDLLTRFPFAEPRPAQISRTDSGAQAAERENLLNESLAEHLQELKQHASQLLLADRWKKSGNGNLLTLDAVARETLLQILNDIRIGSWRALGQPELLDGPVPQQDRMQRQLMDLAGYFEMSLLAPE